MRQITTIRSFSLYFTDRETMRKAISIITSDRWGGDYEKISDHIADEYSIVEFWWDDITPDRIQQFLNEINRIAQ